MKNSDNSTCCGDVTYVSSISISTWKAELAVGDTAYVYECVQPREATNKKVRWSSSDNAIATVNPDSGLVTGQGLGTVVITATAVDRGIVTATYVMEIVPFVYVQSLTLSTSQIVMNPGDKATIDVQLTPSNVTKPHVKWSCTNDCVITIDGLGHVIANKPGESTITVRTSDGTNLSATCKVIVEAVPVEAVTIESTSENMNVGDEIELVATICPANATNKTIKWHSTNENVATVGIYTGKVTAHKAGTAEIVATTVDGNFVDSCKIWVKGKTPVILIHGRGDNSQTAWGIINGITVGTNNHFNSSINAENTNSKNYTLVCSQEITNILPSNEEDVDSPYNLGDKLKQEGYKENINLFAFNYPNEDAVVHSAEKLKKYIENLVDDVRTSGTNEEKACFYASKEDYNANNYKINLVGHSMGGLVARYYIENLGQDDKVDKLITICTPHWGSNLANYSNGTGILHVLCDHDLTPNSAMYGGNNLENLENGCTLWDITDLWQDCTNDFYQLTGELQFSRDRQTKYYAVAGVAYDAYYLHSDNNPFNMPSTFTTYQQIADFMFENKVYKMMGKDSHLLNEIDLESEGDNVVSFLSQIGWTNNVGETPNKQIRMEKIFIVVDADGGNSITDHLHGKMPHRECVLDKVLNYLFE